MAKLDKDKFIGTVLQNRYRIVNQLAEGSMSVVYQGVRIGIDRPVAVKFLHPLLEGDAVYRKRFELEAKVTSQLAHPNCVTIIDFGEIHVPYIVMDLMPGFTLSQLVAQGPTVPQRSVKIIRQALLGLDHAHRLGILHRDIKPDNIMLNEITYGGDNVRIFDFGLVKMLDGEHSSGLFDKDIAAGTLDYMSPEIIGGQELDVRSDLFSMGVVLYLLLSGRKPFRANETVDVLTMHKLPPPSLRGAGSNLSISPELEYMVAKALAIDPRDRFQTASEFIEALDFVPEGEAIRTISVPSLSREQSSDEPSRYAPARELTPLSNPRSRELNVGAALTAAIPVFIGCYKRLHRPISRKLKLGAAFAGAVALLLKFYTSLIQPRNRKLKVGAALTAAVFAFAIGMALLLDDAETASSELTKEGQMAAHLLQGVQATSVVQPAIEEKSHQIELVDTETASPQSPEVKTAALFSNRGKIASAGRRPRAETKREPIAQTSAETESSELPKSDRKSPLSDSGGTASIKPPTADTNDSVLDELKELSAEKLKEDSALRETTTPTSSSVSDNLRETAERALHLIGANAAERELWALEKMKRVTLLESDEKENLADVSTPLAATGSALSKEQQARANELSPAKPICLAEPPVEDKEPADGLESEESEQADSGESEESEQVESGKADKIKGLPFIMSLIHSGRREFAISRLQKMEVSYPNNAYIKFLLANLLSEKRQWQQALRYYRKTIHLDEKYRTHKLLIFNSVHALAFQDSEHEAVKFIREELADAAIPELRRVSNGRYSKSFKERAHKLLKKLTSG